MEADNNWNTKFFNIDVLKTTHLDNIINNNKFINNIEIKIEEIEENYITKMNEIKTKYEANDITIIYKNKNALEILQRESEIVKLISKYSLQNNKLDTSFILICLKYLYKLSELLRNRLIQPIVNLNKNYKNISRCSYKFCNFKENCSYNYGKKGNACYQDHYVHNMVSHDVSSLISFIESNYTEQSQIIHNKEILKTINTLSFVIGHMETELKAKCLYHGSNDWEKYHFVNMKI